MLMYFFLGPYLSKLSFFVNKAIQSYFTINYKILLILVLYIRYLQKMSVDLRMKTTAVLRFLQKCLSLILDFFVN